MATRAKYVRFPAGVASERGNSGQLKARAARRVLCALSFLAGAGPGECAAQAGFKSRGQGSARAPDTRFQSIWRNAEGLGGLFRAQLFDLAQPER